MLLSCFMWRWHLGRPRVCLWRFRSKSRRRRGGPQICCLHFPVFQERDACRLNLSLTKRHWSLQVGKRESLIKPSFINTCDPWWSPRCRKPSAGTHGADLVCQKRIYFFGGCEFFLFIEGEEFNEHEFLRTPGAEKQVGAEPSLSSAQSSHQASVPTFKTLICALKWQTSLTFDLYCVGTFISRKESFEH